MRAIAQAVLYEGYLLWPYRASALKNRQRFGIGDLLPREWCRAHAEGDAWSLRLEVLVEAAPDARLDVEVRFLHGIERRVARRESAELRCVDVLDLGDASVMPWDEAMERQQSAGGVPLAALESPNVTPIEIAGGSEEHAVCEVSGAPAAILRSWQPLEGTVSVRANRIRSQLFQVRVDVANTAAGASDDRRSALRRSFASAHVVLHAPDGRFVSATDPPPRLRPAARRCQQAGVWPVLVGPPEERHTLLASPIILEDHPRIAPESPGDHFDATEIDELLVLSLRALGEAERREVRATDPRAREILERSDALHPEALRRLHGAIRKRGGERGGQLGGEHAAVPPRAVPADRGMPR